MDLLYVLDIPSHTPVWPVEVAWETPAYSGHGRPAGPRPVEGQRQEVRERAAGWAAERWQAIPIA